jgi:predicted nucleotidyltransferase
MQRFDTYILDEIFEERRRKLEQERKYVLSVARKTLFDIRRKYGIGQAFILGSLVQSNRWDSFSDVDVAVSDCSASVLEIMRELEVATQRQVDVIDLDSHPDPRIVKRRGEKLYG